MAEPASPTSNKPYDLVVVGAGIAGLNALAVGSSYLQPTDRVLLIDRRRRVGGMWVDTYPYVRLHQPHPFFTASDIPWTSGEDRAHLATKHEVLDHFTHCMHVVRGRVQLEQWFDTDYVGYDASDADITVTCRTRAGETRVARTRRLVEGTGLEIETNDPISVSSERIHSVSPDSCDLRTGEIAESSAPVWIVGGGKSAMDAAHALITAHPGREVNLLAGSGTMFMDRDDGFPTGARRWYGGHRGYPVFHEFSGRFDGTNEHDVLAWLLANHGHSVTPVCGNFVFGLLSRAEAHTIRSGLTHVVMDHLVDAVDVDGGVDLVLRRGGNRRVEAGSWLVNCTGYILNRPPLASAPYMAAEGRVASVTPTSMITWLTSFQSYFSTHLLMLGLLADLPLYQVDADTLARRSRAAWACSLVAAHMHNLSVIFDEAPREVFSHNGLDFERWFPAHRQLLSNLAFMRSHHEIRKHNAASLDRVAERFDVSCGPLRQKVAA